MTQPNRPIRPRDKAMGAVFIMLAIELDEMDDEMGLEISRELYQRLRDRANASVWNTEVDLTVEQRFSAAELTSLLLATIADICDVGDQSYP